MNKNIFSRSCVSFAAVILPVILLIKGIYGSFLFSFSVPIVWEIGFLGRSLASLGIRPAFVRSSILAGAVSGCILGFLGGMVLKLFGITGYIFSSMDNLRLSLGPLDISFSLQKEVGYRLLAAHNASGTCLFFIFCIFLIGIGEEIFWRGFIQKKIASRLSAGAAIWVTAVLFAMIHFYIFTILPLKAGVLFLALIAFAGAVWGYLFRHFGSIWAAAVSHGITAFIIWKYFFFK